MKKSDNSVTIGNKHELNSPTPPTVHFGYGALPFEPGIPSPQYL